MAASCDNETLLLDWLTSLSGNILEKFAEHPDPATIVLLTRLLREGVTRRMGGMELVIM